jgi:hypothetical protein
LVYHTLMPSPPPTPFIPKPSLDPLTETLATGWLTARRGKPQWAGPPSLAKLATRILPQSERTGGVGVVQLQARWSEIVGEKIASVSQPDLIKGETLVVKVAAAAAPLMAMRSDEIIGLVRLAGAAKIKKLTFIRAPITKPSATKPNKSKRPLNAQEQRELDQKLQHVTQIDLRAALKRLADATSDID